MLITRFAPSPSGHLHLGHAASAAKAYGLARAHDGICLLRIEDIDTGRCRPEYENSILEDLAWLGWIDQDQRTKFKTLSKQVNINGEKQTKINWASPNIIRRQSDHFNDYAVALETLKLNGLVYPCFKTRKTVMEHSVRAPHGDGKIYTGPKTQLSQDEIQSLIKGGKNYAWRLSISACRDFLGARFDALKFSNHGQIISAVPDLLGDVILARKDAPTSYHLASCHDDALSGITDIVRGVDLLPSTHIHVLLQALMDWPTPHYHHHELLLGADGKRLAKRDHAATLTAMREAGTSAQNVLARVSGLG